MCANHLETYMKSLSFENTRSSYFELVQCKTTNFDINIFKKWYTIKLVACDYDATQQIYWLSDRNVHTSWHIYPHEYTNCIFSFFSEKLYLFTLSRGATRCHFLRVVSRNHCKAKIFQWKKSINLKSYLNSGPQQA